MRVVGALCLAIAVAGSAAAATGIRFDSDPGDYVGQGRRTWLGEADGTLTAVAMVGGVHAFFQGTLLGNTWSLDFTAPGGIAVGTYENATRFSSRTAPGLDVEGDGRGCNATTGRFVVRAAEFDPGGAPTTFVVDFEQHCEGGAAALFGTVEYRAGDAGCASQPDDTPCDDGDACTTGDRCRAGACIGTTSCGAEGTCAIPFCSPRNGACADFDRHDGTPCDAGNPSAVCQAGLCGGPSSTTTTTLCPAAATQALAASPARAARFATRHHASWSVRAEAAAGPRLRTVPYFSDAFSSGGFDYDYRMVGTNPRRSHRRTVVPVVVVPIRFVFADGTRFDPGRTTGQLRRSPIFRRSTYGTDVTQFADAMRRAEFWQWTQGTSYHVLLAPPSVTKTALVRVPANQGGVVGTSHGGTVGVVNESYFSQHVVPGLVNHLHLPPTKLIVFWSFDVDLVTPGDVGVIVGEHGDGHDASRTIFWTWAWASWHTAGGAEADVAALSHEVAEWYDDPFGTNVVPEWEATFYPCNDHLENGDPLVGAVVEKDGFHVQDIAFLSWFARDVPSKAAGGAYSLFGTLTSPARDCGTGCPAP